MTPTTPMMPAGGGRPEPLVYAPQAPVAGEPRGSAGPLLIAAAAVVVPGAIAYGLLTANEAQVVAVLAAALAGFVILARPFWGLMLFVALLYTRPEESIPGLAGLHLPLLVAVVTMVGAWIQMFLEKQRVARTPMNLMVMGFFAVAILSSSPAGTAMEAALDISRLAILVVLVLNLVRTPQRYRFLVVGVILVTAYLSAYSIYLYHSGDALLRGDDRQALATGIFSDPNDLSATIVAGLALTLWQAASQRGRARWLFMALALLMTAAVFFTNSRGGMIALVVTYCVFVLRFQKRKLLAACLAGIVVVALFVAASGSRMTDFDTSEGSANSRFHFWMTAVYTLEAHPILGVGYSRFADYNDGMVAHNSFAQCFAELGLAGFFCWMGCIYYAERRWAGEKGASEPLACDLAGAKLALTAYLVAAFWISRTYTPVLYLLFSLPECRQLISADTPAARAELGRISARDLGRVGALALAAIILIDVLALRYR